MNMKQWVADVISQTKVTAVPVMTHPGIEQNGNTVREAVSNGKVHAEAVIKLAEAYRSTAACTIMDLTTEAEAFGAEIAFSDEAVPAVVGHMLTDAKSINDLQVPSLSAGRIPQYLKANLLAARAIKDRPVFAGCIVGWSSLRHVGHHDADLRESRCRPHAVGKMYTVYREILRGTETDRSQWCTNG